MRHVIWLATFAIAAAAYASGWDEIQREQAARAGIDCHSAAKRAYARDDAGLTTMFRVTPALDGGGAEGHSHDLQKLLRLYGDERFAALLRRERRPVRQSVVDSLDFAFELYSRRRDWSSLYPQTFAIAPHPLIHQPRPSKT